MTEHIGACTIVVNKSGKILLGVRKGGYKPGTYGLPGGRVDLVEPVQECASRELTEETTLKAKSLNFVGVVRELQDSYNFIHFVFECKNFSGMPKCTEPNKCEGWDWYDSQKLPSPLLPGHKGALEMYLKNSGPLKELI